MWSLLPPYSMTLAPFGDKDSRQIFGEGKIRGEAIEEVAPAVGSNRVHGAGGAMEIPVERGQMRPHVWVNGRGPHQKADCLLQGFAQDLLGVMERGQLGAKLVQFGLRKAMVSTPRSICQPHREMALPVWPFFHDIGTKMA